MTIEQVQQILDDISYIGILEFIKPKPKVQIEHGHYLIKVELQSLDPKTRKPVTLTIETRIPKDSNEKGILIEMREFYRRFFLHEVCESMLYKGKLPFDPHPEVLYG